MSNDIQALRTHLFETLQALKDKDNPMDIDRAKTVCQVGDVIINSAKAEIEFARVNGNVDTQFFHRLPAPTSIAMHPEKQIHQETQITQSTKHGTVTIEGNITTHKMK